LVLKAFGLAMVLTVTVSAAAEQVTGRIETVAGAS
jgi:hypothetical protein